MPRRPRPANKHAYARHRMGLAIDRMVSVPAPELQQRAMRWVLAWSVAAGYPPPARQRLRPRARLLAQ